MARATQSTKGTKRKKAGWKVDFTGVESGGKVLSEGRHLLQVDSIEEKEGESSGEPYLAVKFKVVSDKGSGTPVYDNFSLQPQSLWKLRGMLESMGVEVDGEFEFTSDDLADHTVGAEIVHEEYQGKVKNRISGYFMADEFDDSDDEEDEEEEEEAPKAKASKKPAAASKAKGKAKDEEEEDEEEEEDDEPAPKAKAKGKAAASKKKDEDEEDDEEDDAPEWKVKQRVSFKEGKKSLEGKIIEIDADEGMAVVKVGTEEYEVDFDELSALK